MKILVLSKGAFFSFTLGDVEFLSECSTRYLTCEIELNTNNEGIFLLVS